MPDTPGSGDSDIAQPPDDLQAAGLSQAEIDEWAARERKRREAWLAGPTETEKALWAERESERRSGEAPSRRPRLPRGDASRLLQRYAREMQLATEGAFSLVFNLSLNDAFERLVQAGREWEQEFSSAPARRRRVALEPDASEMDVRPRSTRVPTPPEGPHHDG